MKKIVMFKCIAVSVLFIMSISVKIFAQLPEFNYKEKAGVPVFYFDAVSFADSSSDSTAISIFTKICYDELQFVKTEPGFKASYELTIVLFNKAGEDSGHKIVKKEIEVPIYDKTNSRKLFNITKTKFLLKHGIYRADISLTDFNTKKTRKMKTDIEVPRFFSDNLMLSDILLADTVLTDSMKRYQIKPNVFGNYLDSQKAIYLYSEVYTKENIPEVEVKLKLVDKDDNTTLIKKFSKKLTGSITPLVLELNRGNLSNGRYTIVLTVESENYVAGQRRSVMIKWLNMPAVSSNLDQAIEQMKWIAKSSFLKKLRSMKKEDKKKTFTEFWKSLDPSPGTEENEILEEYYHRVEIADDNFGTLKSGWKTDRGMVYIILGPPDDVERHPFETSSKPYEIWFYQQFNHSLVFVDEHGYGEYRLVNPEQFWEMMNRVR